MSLLKKNIIFLSFIIFLLLISCNKNNNNNDNNNKNNKNDKSNTSETLDNDKSNDSKIEIKWKDIKFEDNYNNLTYPEFYNLDESIEKKINTNVKNLVKEIKSTKDFCGLTYKITYNKNNLISIRYFNSFQISNGSRLIYYQSQNFNIETGETLKLKNFFDDGFDYSEVINNNISYHFGSNPNEIYENSIFEGIEEDNDNVFYLTDEGFSFYFPPYKYKENDANGPLDILVEYTKFGINLKLIDNGVDSKEISKKEDARKEFIEFLKNGKFQDSKFGIGNDINDIKNSLGTPDDSGEFEGANYYVYDNESYFTPIYTNTNIQKDKVTAIVISKGIIFKEIKIGNSIKDIESIIGELYKTYDEDDNWFAYCELENNYIIRFYSSDANIISTAELNIKY